MFALPRFFAALCTALVAATFVGLVPESWAIPPLKPSNVRVDVTRAIDVDLAAALSTPGQTPVKFDDLDSFMFRWTDNAFDEEGYKVEYRFGNIGPFTSLTGAEGLGANSDSYVAAFYRLPKDTMVQFQISAFKFNGGKVEYAYAPLFSYTAVDGNTNFGPPTAPSAEVVDDGTIKLKWTDASGNEVHQQILSKKHADTNYTALGYIDFNLAEYPLRLGLIPGEQYDFVVRATRRRPADGSSFTVGEVVHVTAPSDPVTVTIPPLTAPSGLIGSVKDETTVQLSWADNSNNETGYQIEYRPLSSTDFTVLGVVSANTETVPVPTPPATTVEWRVRAIYKTTTVTTAIESAATSPTIQLSTAFPGPTELVAVTSPTGGAVDLTWKDNSAAEGGYEILTRPAAGGEFAVALRPPPGTTTATISSRLNAGGTAMIPLELDQTHEFAVRAFYGNIYSASSNLASAEAKDGFASRFYHHGTVGLAYTSLTQYQLAVTNASALTSWNITGLATVGLGFNTGTGVISGAPTLPGVFTFPMTATYSTGRVANATLTLRILRPPATPTSQVIAPITIAPNTSFAIPLASKFFDPESETAVRLNTTKGNIDILLYPSLAPQAVANFIAYVNAGDYNGVVFHRSIPGFVIQGGAFKPVATPKSYSAVAARPSPTNEPGISNVRGTISAAKQGNNPHSATHDFFLNLADNNDYDDPQSLDNQNGGFTAFGRVATPVEDLTQSLASVYPVMSAIALLPRGNYIDFNTDTSDDDSLDKRILVDSSPAGFSDWPMDVTGSAPSDMDVTKNVFINSAQVIPVLDYSILTNTAPEVVSAVLSGGTLQLRGLKVGATTITVKATDLDAKTTQQTFAVTVTANHKAPVITRQPVAQAVVFGAKATFTVAATGTALTYQWRKADENGDFQPVPGAHSSPTLAINNVQAANIGLYQVLVINATTTLTSNTVRLDQKAAPVITTHPISKVVNVGQPLVLDVAATGGPAPTIAWLRGAAVVAGQTKPQLNILAAKLTDGGIYTARATNPTNKATSNPANVYVVDAATVVTTLKVGGKATLKAAVSGPVQSYQWHKNGGSMGADDADTRIKGRTSSTLTITAATLADGASYTCVVTTLGGLGPVTTGIQKMAVVVRPAISNYTAATGVVGFDYDFLVPYDTTLTNTPDKFSLAPMPPGLVYNAKTGRITGRPTVAGRYSVGTTISNAAGSSTLAIGTLDIIPMSQYGVGTFLGAVEPSALNNNKGGRLDLTTLDTGTYTGRLVLGVDSYSFAGKVTYYPGVLLPQAQIIIPRKGKTPILLQFAVDEADGDMEGLITDGISSSEVIGFRQFWNTTWRGSDRFAGLYNIGLNLRTADVGVATIPQGSGYVAVTVTKGGTAWITVRMPDGVSVVTTSSIVGLRGEFLIYQMLYKNTGSILGMSGIGSNINLDANGNQLFPRILRVAGTLRWIKDAQTAAAERSYKAGIGPVDLDMLGRNYLPVSGTPIMNLPLVANNAKLVFSQGGLPAAPAPSPNLTVTVGATNAITLPADNPTKVKVTYANGSGLYTGSYELVDAVSGIKRPVTFQGMLVQRIPLTPGIAATQTTNAVAEIPASDAKAAGYFLLNQLGSAGPPVTTATTSPILSGKVELRPADILINSVTTNPVATTVNPGTAYSFTVSASGQGTLTYQWRKNGVNIATATATTYSIATVAESHQGSYDVLVSNGSTTTASTPINLEVNNPVTSIAITRSTPNSFVATGQPVTFTATPEGSGTFTYQWLKNDSPITGVISENQHTISSADAAQHDGNYSVTVFSEVSPAGVTSGHVPLTVIDPVSNVTASRLPTDNPISAGQSVTFTGAALGGGTLAFQWRKAGIPIENATQNTFTINTLVGGDSGDYDVVVTNPVTATPVASNSLNLTVTDMVLNVVATRDPAGILAVGEAVQFSVTAQGTGLTYQWMKDGAIIESAVGQTYNLIASESDNTVTYSVVVSNTATPSGVPSNGLNLVVQTPISDLNIVQNPIGGIQVGNSVTFTATATGSDLNYQWRKGTMDLAGQTGNTLTIASATEADSGDYYVVVSNGVGTANSNTISLAVTP